MKARARVVSFVLFSLFLWVNSSAVAEDVHLRAAGPSGIGYIGLYYGLVNPTGGAWYEAEDLMGSPSTTWLAVADTGASATILGKSTQDAYAAGTPIPLQPYPAVKFSDIGFGGTEDFAVTHSLQVMIAGQKAAAGDTENHSLYTAYTPPMTLAAARDYIGGGVEIPLIGTIDLDIVGTSTLQGQVLRVDPHSWDALRLVFMTMAGSLGQTPPPAGGNVLYVPMTMQNFFTGPQEAEVGANPMLAMKIRRTASDAFAERSALFDTGSPANFVSESFAIAAGIDTSGAPEETITVSGVGGAPVTRPGWYVDALALELAAGREGDDLAIGNTVVFVIPDANMPGGLDAILGNGAFSDHMSLVGMTPIVTKTDIVEWYVDMRDDNNAFLVVVVPEPASAILMLLGAVAIIRRRVNRDK